MEDFYIVLAIIALLIIGLPFAVALYSACVISGRQSRKEEKRSNKDE